MAEALWTNTIGNPALIAVWKDPDFDPKQRAFYYARVIEIPTPRRTAYDAKRFGVKMPPEVPMTIQDRAYTKSALVHATMGEESHLPMTDPWSGAQYGTAAARVSGLYYARRHPFWRRPVSRLPSEHT